MKDLITVGGASASLTAAIYARRAGLDVMVVTDEYGGQINNTDVVENYLGFKSISGPELADKYVEHMREYEIEEKVGEKVVDIRKNDGVFEVETESGDVEKAYSVILGTGGSRRRLNVPGEEKLRNKGVAYCAVCDGPLYQGEEVAVVGGGYAGTEAAAYLSGIAEKVHVINTSDELDGEEITIEEAKSQDNVNIIHNSRVKEITGDNLVDGLKYEKDGEIHRLDVTGVFVEIGTVPNSGITDLVETDEEGYIKVEESLETDTEGLYAAGDVNDIGPQQLAVSSGQGCQAALNAADYVKEQKKKS
jgi:alkyl hydroperoxide reductase subunit F